MQVALLLIQKPDPLFAGEPAVFYSAARDTFEIVCKARNTCSLQHLCVDVCAWARAVKWRTLQTARNNCIIACSHADGSQMVRAAGRICDPFHALSASGQSLLAAVHGVEAVQGAFWQQLMKAARAMQ